MHSNEDGAVREPGQTAADGRPEVIKGTWDFKWPAGTVIRVAFQRLPEDVDIERFTARGKNHEKLFEEGKLAVEQKLNAWFSGKRPPNLSCQLVGDLPAPPARESARENGKPRLARSIFKSVDAKNAKEELAYDVLISFLPLPVRLPATEQFPKEAVVTTSSSELGRYASRIEYGVPTTYLGPIFRFDPSEESWFDSADGQFAVVHELGHVLGLAHEHQNPLYEGEIDWKDEKEILDILKKRPGLDPKADHRSFFETEVKRRWSRELQFSDWRKPADTAPLDFKSVMAKPSVQCLINGAHASTCTPERCEELKEALKTLETPTEADLNHLCEMYGERPRDTQSNPSSYTHAAQ